MIYRIDNSTNIPFLLVTIEWAASKELRNPNPRK